MPPNEAAIPATRSAPPLVAAFLPLPAAELRTLAASIAESGELEPVLGGGLLLVGRDRFEACQVVGVEPVFRRSAA